MEGSDDYFGDDDFVLDETTLAALDLEEQKWQQQQQTQATTAGQRRPVSNEAREPPPKRRKMSHETTPEGLIPQIRAVTVADDYDEDLPDIAIIGEGLYNLPAARAAQMRGEQSRGYASTSTRPHARVPGPPPRTPATAPTHAPAPPQRRTPSGGSSIASGSGSGVGFGYTQDQPSSSRPPQRNRLPRKHSTLSSVQAALADFVPPASNPVPAPTPPPRGPPSRGSPAPGPSRVTAAPSVRPTVRAPSGAGAAPGRSARGASPSVSGPHGRRQSVPVAGPSRQHRASASIPPQPPPPLQPPYQPPLSQGQSDRNLRIEVETLKAQVEELVKAQQKATTDLEEARNVRYAKEGEVSILRKSIEKAAKDHAAEVARIKTAKEEAEAMQVHIRKEMREELERAKTQYLFKQHELETSARKTPWSSKIRRAENPPPPTQVSASTQREQQIVVEEQPPLQTPSRPRPGADLSVSPQRQHRKKVVHIPESPPKKPAKMRGFINAFDPTPSSLRLNLSQASQSTQVGRKGKARAKVIFDFSEAQNEDLFFNPPPATNELQYQEPHSQPSSSALPEHTNEVSMHEAEEEPQVRSSPPDVTAEPVGAPETKDVEMKEEAPKPADPVDPVDPLLMPDWTREFQRIVLTHRHRTIEQTTLQRLIDHKLPSTASSEEVQKYTTRVVTLLDDLGMIAVWAQGMEQSFLVVTTTLCSIGDILCETQSFCQLAALVDILKILTLFISPYVPTMLAPSGTSGSANMPPVILEFLGTVVLSALDPNKKHDQGQDLTTLATEAFGLLEAIFWHTPQDLLLPLTYFICAPDVLNVLADPKQPLWISHRLTRILALLASCKNLHKHLLTLQVSDDAEGGDAGAECCSIPYLERLAMMLVDSGRGGTQYWSLRQSIIHLLTILVIHDDSTTRAILVQSDIIVPAVIHFLYYLTDPLYEEGEEFLEQPELVTWSIDMITRVIPLLGRILKDTDFDSIRMKLVNPKKRTFAGLFHMYTVALGRVSFAEIPKALPVEDRVKLRRLYMMAEDVLELVVDGPEMELIWDAFQTVPPDKSSELRSTQRHLRRHHGDEQSESEG